MESDNRKRPFYLYQLLNELTDEDHELTTNEIVDLLWEKYGLRTQRTRIAQDVELLQEIEAQVEEEKRVDIQADALPGRPSRYCVLGRKFEPSEIKLLIDAIHSSLFLTEEKSRMLSEKLLGLISVYQAEAIRRTIVDNALLKHENGIIMYIVDTLVQAILKKRQVCFKYFRYDTLKRRVNTNDNLSYIVSPYALIWSEDNYYLICFSEKHQAISHFRVDRIADVPELLATDCVPLPEDFDLARYKKGMLRMFGSRRVEVELACDESVMNGIYDRLGLDADIGLIEEHIYSVTAEVAVNHIFYSWVFGFGGKVKILNPPEVVKGYADLLLAAAEALNDPV